MNVLGLNMKTLMICALLVSISVACSNPKNGRSELGAPPPTLSDTGGNGKRGTSHTGGGTGIDGRVFEGYQVNPYTLEATTQILFPLFEKFQPQDFDSEKGSYIPLLSGKVWYIAPLALDDVAIDSLGLDFIGADTDQLARQSLGEVWIDKNKFDQMTLQEQAELILHEMVMSEYMMRFKDWEGICNEYAFFGGLFTVSENPEGEDTVETPISCKESQQQGLFGKVFPRIEAPRPLNEQDNIAIRNITSWILSSKGRDDIHGQERLANQMIDNGFDERKWIFFNDDSQNAPLSLTMKEIMLSLQKVAAGVFQFNKCFSTYDGQWRPCEFELKKESEVATLNNFEIALKQDGQNLSEPFFIFDTDEVEELSAVGKNLYTKLLVRHHPSVEVGDLFYSVFAFLKPQSVMTPNPLLDVEFFALIPGKVFHVEKDEFGMVQGCLTGRIEDATSRATAPILVGRSSSPERIPHNVQVLLHSMPTYLSCSFRNRSEETSQ